MTPRQDNKEVSVPCHRLFRYSWRVPYDVDVCDNGHVGSHNFVVGDEVWVKPAHLSCTKQWASDVVTKVVSRHVSPSTGCYDTSGTCVSVCMLEMVTVTQPGTVDGLRPIQFSGATEPLQEARILTPLLSMWNMRQLMIVSMRSM